MTHRPRGSKPSLKGKLKSDFLECGVIHSMGKPHTSGGYTTLFKSKECSLSAVTKEHSA